MVKLVRVFNTVIGALGCLSSTRSTPRGGGDIRGPYTPFPPALPACSPHEGLTEQRRRDTVEHAIEDVFESLVVAEWNGVCFVFIFELRIEWREERWEQSGAPKTLRVSDGQEDARRISAAARAELRPLWGKRFLPLPKTPSSLSASGLSLLSLRDSSLQGRGGWALGQPVVIHSRGRSLAAHSRHPEVYA
ncbi:unnamed protein product [Gadus morhua 'NCC']